MGSSKFLLTLILFASFALAAGARELHVALEPLPGVASNAQFRTIAAATSKLAPGDVVLVHGGIYREDVVISASGSKDQPITIRAADGALVILTGADRITDWAPVPDAEGVHSTDWSHKFNTDSRHYTKPDNNFHRLIGRCEQVFVNGYALNQVLERGELGRGAFYVDSTADRLYIRPSHTTEISESDTCVEVSSRQRLMSIEGDHIRVKGIRFRYAANRAQRGAVDAIGNHLLLADCAFEYTNSSGAAFRGQDIMVRNCVFQHNGQLGFGAKNAHRLRMTECTVRNNNTKGFDRDWEAGGDKIVLTRGALFERCTFVDNRGHGIWYDIGNEDCEVTNCLIANNENAGIFYEISFGLHAHDNVIVGNGLAFSPNSWGASAGISLSSSPGCRIERNLFLGNKEGFAFREQARSTPLINRRSEEPVWNHDQIVTSNIFAFNRDAQVWGWFDVPDQRMWPKSMQKQDADSPPSEDSSRPSGPPANVSLEKLRLDFRNNLFCVGPGQALFRWGVPWKNNKEYHHLDKVQADLAFAAGSDLEQLQFLDGSANNLRIPADSRALEMDCYPHGSVPGVVLGVRDERGTVGEQDPFSRKPPGRFNARP